MKKTSLVLLSATMTFALASCDMYGKKDFAKFQEKVEKIKDVSYSKATVKLHIDDNDYKVKLEAKKLLGVTTWTQAEGDSNDLAIVTSASTIISSLRVQTVAVAEDKDAKYYTGLFGGFKVTVDEDGEKSLVEFNKYGYVVKYKDGENKASVSYKK